MAYYRIIEKQLEKWAASESRKPLILRGARQVGKTTAVRQFAQRYKQFVPLNLETNDADFFLGKKDIHALVNELFFVKGVKKSEANTLIFIDEIQEVPSAIMMLRYFYEEYPQYHVIAAGSLLESLFDSDISYPVGRTDYLYMYPVSFAEFLGAMGEEEALEAYRTIPVPSFAVGKLMKLFHTYTLVGGMPEAVERYARSRDVVELKPVYDSLLLAYLGDVAKYAKSEKMAHVMRHCIRASFAEAGERIKFVGFGRSAFSSKEVSAAMQALQKALLVHLTYPTTQTALPFAPDVKRAPRLQVLDTGLLNYFSNVQHEFFSEQNLNAIYKGRIAEHIVAQELICASNNLLQPLLFWVREKNGSCAEVDFLVPTAQGNIPIEVKSGATGRLKSLHLYMEESSAPLAIRLYAGSLCSESLQTPSGKPFTLLNLPYCFAAQVREYAEFFLMK